MSDELTLYLVTHTDDNGENQDYFVTARSQSEAFELWRMNLFAQGDVPANCYAVVWEVPQKHESPKLHGWPSGKQKEYSLRHTDLTTMAVRVAHGLHPDPNTEPTLTCHKCGAEIVDTTVVSCPDGQEICYRCFAEGHG